jgi:hypothetical protein
MGEYIVKPNTQYWLYGDINNIEGTLINYGRVFVANGNILSGSIENLERRSLDLMCGLVQELGQCSLQADRSCWWNIRVKWIFWIKWVSGFNASGSCGSSGVDGLLRSADQSGVNGSSGSAGSSSINGVIGSNYISTTKMR